MKKVYRVKNQAPQTENATDKDAMNRSNSEQMKDGKTS